MQSRLNKFLSQYNNEYMTIGQAKAKPYWFALCLTDVFYYLCIGFSKESRRFLHFRGN